MFTAECGVVMTTTEMTELGNPGEDASLGGKRNHFHFDHVESETFTKHPKGEDNEKLHV